MTRFYPSLPSHGLTLASISINEGHTAISKHTSPWNELQYFSKPGEGKTQKNPK